MIQQASTAAASPAPRAAGTRAGASAQATPASSAPATAKTTAQAPLQHAAAVDAGACAPGASTVQAAPQADAPAPAPGNPLADALALANAAARTAAATSPAGAADPVAGASVAAAGAQETRSAEPSNAGRGLDRTVAAQASAGTPTALGAVAATPFTASASATAKEAPPANGTLPSFPALFAGVPGRDTPAAGSASAIASLDTGAGIPGAQLPASVLASLPGASAAGAAVGNALVHISTPVGDAGFGQDVSRQLVYLAKTGTQSAELSLQPANLGPVSVSIQMNGLDASIAISASHAATRAALQEALPHLHELFQGSGLQLTGAHVGDGSQRHADQGAAQRNPATATNGLGSSGANDAAPVTLGVGVAQAAVGNRLIDTFA